MALLSEKKCLIFWRQFQQENNKKVHALSWGSLLDQLTGGLESTGDTGSLTKRYKKQSLNTQSPKEKSLLTLT